MTRRAVAGMVGAIAGVVILLAFVLIGAGAYNVAATVPHTRLTHWFMHTVMERSVAARADDVPEPPKPESSFARHGFDEYREMCVACHGAPGVERGALGKGMTPRPPELAKEAAEWSDRELFWITKHGIKFAGMPAFGATHSDEELWGIVAFLRQLQYMSPGEYREQAQAATESGAPGHGGMEETTTRSSTGTVAMDHERADHSRSTDTVRRAAAHAPTHRAGAGTEHPAMPDQRGTAGQHRGQADAEATEKLKTLVAGLLRDSVVSAQVRTDSALRRLWDDERVRRQLTRPQR